MLGEKTTLNNGPSSGKRKSSQNSATSNTVYSTVKHQGTLVSATDPACFLSPSRENLHEIHSYKGPAAFLDVLTPPYGYDTRLDHERDCHYYKEIDFSPNATSSSTASSTSSKFHNNSSSSSSTNQAFLVNISTPDDFWCDQAKYEGPPLNHLKEEKSDD